jgi:hypothetical protein
MRVAATDNTAAIIATAQALKNLEAAMMRHAIERKLVNDRNDAQELRFSRRREELLLDQLYFERADTKTKIVKGTNVDLYI